MITHDKKTKVKKVNEVIENKSPQIGISTELKLQESGEKSTEGKTSKDFAEQNDKVITGDVLMSYNFHELPTVMIPILPAVGLGTLGGGSDTGKSSWLRQFAIHMVTGEKQFLGFEISPIHKSVIYVSTEDDQNAISILLKKQTEGKYTADQLKGLRYIFDDTDLLKRLDAELKKNLADVVIIDAFSDIYTGALNVSNEIRAFLNKYSNLAKKHKCLILFLHHTGKTKDGLMPSKHNLLGSQGFEAKMRVVMELRKDGGNPALRHLCIVKGNYLTEEYKNSSFVLRFNNDMTFTNLNSRVPFERLVSGGTNDVRTQAVKKAVELQKEGKSVREIEATFKTAEIPFKKTAIAEMLKGVRPSETPTDVDTDSDPEQ